MAIRAFLSFFEEDLTLVNLFRGQAKAENSQLEFADYSIKEPFDSTKQITFAAASRNSSSLPP